MKKPAPGRVRVFDEFRCVCCLHAGSSRTCWLGNKYEHKNRTQRGGAGVGGFDVGSRWRVVMQHVIERNTAVLAMSTLATEFLRFPLHPAQSLVAQGWLPLKVFR
jgi:hypothetical protein